MKARSVANAYYHLTLSLIATDIQVCNAVYVPVKDTTFALTYRATDAAIEEILE